MSHIYTTTVQPDWIDYNGHMNAGYYAVAFDRALTAFMELFAAQAYLQRTGRTFYTAEAHIVYQHELKEAAPIRIETVIVGLDRKRLHTMQTIFDDARQVQAGTAENMLLHYDQTVCKVTAMPDDLYAAIDAIAQTDIKKARPDHVGRAIRSVGK